MNAKLVEQKLNQVEGLSRVPEIEAAQTPEQQEYEQDVEQNSAETESSTPEAQPPTQRRPRPIRPTGPVISQVRDEVTLRIEKIMEDGVGDAYQRLSPIAKQEFKLKGEQTASKIREMMKSTHIKAKKIFQLILEWLKMLPGVNKFFLEQEAKIKTDRILHLHQKQQGK